YINSKYSYWSSRNVRGPFSIFPFGNLLSRVRVQPQVIELEYMKKYGKVYGSYSGLLPVLSIIDAEDIKQVLIKDFQHFADRRVLNTYNTVFNRNLFQVEGEDWKRIRSIVSPAFTSGKLKGMYGIMNIAIEKLMSYMEERTKRGGLVNTKKVISGFTIDIVLTTIFFEFAHNKEIQERLFEEVLTIAKNTDTSNLDEYFDQLLKNAPYLNAVVSEAIRKYPPVVRLERRVGSDGIKVAGIPVDKGVLIEIPTYAVHHNPEVYPNPEVFNPDRFMPENKHLLVPYTYIGFGDGKSYSHDYHIGMRFALQEIKLCLGQIVQKYQFCKAPDTPKTLSFKKGSPMLNTLPFFVKISKR
ncbi:hypothetical protein TYRP_019945, partial [Tyrophagus putrescentiae]